MYQYRETEQSVGDNDDCWEVFKDVDDYEDIVAICCTETLASAMVDMLNQIQGRGFRRLIDDTAGLPDVMPKIDGVSYRCDCGCNVFRSPSPLIYVCNSCKTRYLGEKKDDDDDNRTESIPDTVDAG